MCSNLTGGVRRFVALSLHGLLADTARRTPDAEALVVQDARFTWAQVADASWRMARRIAAEVGPGERVAILAHNGLEYAAAYYGAMAAGAIAVPVNTAADPRSLAHVLDDCGAKLLVVGPRLERLAKTATIAQATYAEADGLAPLIQGGDDVASIIYTSGSTGRPRGVTLTHTNLVANVRSILAYLPLTADDRVLAVLPFFYVYGKSVLNTAMAAGATVVVENRFAYPSVAVETLARERCTGLAGVPSTFAILLDRTDLATRDLPHLRWVTQAGGAMSPALIRRVIAALPGRDVYVMYGATEAAARLAYVPPAELADSVGAIGRAIPGVTLTVRRPDGSPCAPDEDGELYAEGANVMRGYWNDPDATAAVLGPHGYRTGDLARVDAAGRIWLVGRKQDLFKVAGHRVGAAEIEDAIMELAGVHEAAVVAVPDDVLGDRLVAFVVARDAAIDAAAIGRFLKDRLPAYKIPGRIELRDALPKSAAGKIAKEPLRVDAAALVL